MRYFHPMFQSIRLKFQKRIHRRRDLLQKMEVIERGQQRMADVAAEAVAAEIIVGKTLTDLRDDLRPSLLAWVQAAIVFILSGAILVYAAIATVNESTASYNVAALHQDAQSERTLAFEGVVAYLANPSQKQQDMSSVFDSALTQLRDASSVDAQADDTEHSLRGGQLWTQIALGVGSAFAGAVVAWILTQLLASLRWRRRASPPRSQ
jgi:hypothetical protein